MIGYRSAHVRTLLFYAQDQSGLGHITRAVTIARHVLAAYPDTIDIATRSRIVHHVPLPDHCEYIKLPSRHTPSHILRPPDDDELSKASLRRLRAQILRDVALGLAPHFVLVDHEPLGAGGEFRNGLWDLKRHNPGTRFVYGLRDITDDPDRVRAQWRETGAYEAFEDLYDCIAVYGSPSLFDVADAYGLSPSVRAKLHYCGYIVREPPVADPQALRQQYGLPSNGRLVLATVGSGSDGYPALEAALTAVERLQAQIAGLSAILVTGPFMPPEQQAALAARATPARVVVSQADTFALMTVADAIVSMGGYNSVCEALVAARPLVIVPRSTHKVEQQIRARVLAERGLARWVHPGALNGGDALTEALDWALRRDTTSHARLVREVVPAFDGAIQLTAYLARWLDASIAEPRARATVRASEQMPAAAAVHGAR